MHHGIGIFMGGVLGGVILSAMIGVVQLTAQVCGTAESDWVCGREWIVALGTLGALISIVFLIWQVVVLRRQVFSLAIDHLKENNRLLQSINRSLISISVLFAALQEELRREPKSASDLIDLIDTIHKFVDADDMNDKTTSSNIPEEISDRILIVAMWWNDRSRKLREFQDILVEATIDHHIGYGAKTIIFQERINASAAVILDDFDSVIKEIEYIRPMLTTIIAVNRRRLNGMSEWMGEEVDSLLRRRQE